MRVISKLLPVLLVFFVIAGWIVTVMSLSTTGASASDYLEAARESVESGLYDQAIEQYQKAYAADPTEQTCLEMAETFEAYYSEEPRDEVRDRYIATMEAAADQYPGQTLFWERACDLYLASEQYSRAYRLLQRAWNMGASSEKLSEIGTELSYTTSLQSRLYYHVKNSLNGCMTVDTGSEYQVLDDSGKRIVDGYELIGLINSDGWGVYVNGIDARLIDADGIARARFDIDIADAGEIDSETGLVPVSVDGDWRYLNVVEGTLGEGAYSVAGCFSGGKAAVKKGKSWFLINESGERVSDKFEEIKLDLHGSWVHDGIVLAKQSGQFSLFDEALSKISDFACDGIDVYAQDGSPIAYKSDDKWGFVDPSGNVVCEPTFAKAKSFANGFAAVSEDGVLWGYANQDFKVVVDCAYTDALYFNAAGNSWVSLDSNAYQMLGFVFGG